VELHVTAGAVSAQVKTLEEHLGVALFRRLTRALELTGEGQTLLPKVREGLETLRTAVERLRTREERATLTVVAPPNFAARWLVPRLQGFTSQHPELELHVASRQSMVDGGEPTERFVEAREDAPTVAIRFGSGHYAASRVDEIFPVDYVPVCSPSLANGPLPLRTPEDLRRHTLIHDDTVTEGAARPSWNDWLEAAGVHDVDVERGPTSATRRSRSKRRSRASASRSPSSRCSARRSKPAASWCPSTFRSRRNGRTSSCPRMPSRKIRRSHPSGRGCWAKPRTRSAPKRSPTRASRPCGSA
jgi:DNA-binding transcriptional LysR family regulator